MQKTAVWLCDAIVAPYSPLVVADGAEGYWPLDDAGDTAVDHTGHSHDGAIVGAVARQQPGPITEFPAGAIQCAVPASGRLVLPSIPLPTTPAYTLECWFAVPSGGGRAPLLSTLTAPDPVDPAEFMVGLHDDGSLAFYQPTHRNPDSAGALADLRDGQWHHFVAQWGVVIEGAPQLALWIDGVLIQRYVTNFVLQSLAAMAPWAGSTAYWPPPESWEGPTTVATVSVASVAVYPSLLTVAQIRAHHDQGATATTPPSARGHVAFSGSDPANVDEIVFTRNSADEQDTSAWFAALAVGDAIALRVFNDAGTFGTYMLDAPPREELVGGERDVLYWLTVHNVAASGAMIVADQRIQWVTADAAVALGIGDLVVNGVAFEIVPANSTALVVATAVDGVLLLFRDGTQARFDDAALTQYAIWTVGHDARYEGYVYDTDLRLHEDWRGGFFDPVWLPHPPAGAFAVFAQGRGASGQTAPFTSKE